MSDKQIYNQLSMEYNDPNKQIYDTITLPNGGIIMLDRLAYEAYDSCSQTNHKKDWKVVLTFDSSDIERAVVENKGVEIR